MDDQHVGRTFKTLQALFWGTFASGMFTSLYLKEFGLSATVIGSIFAARSVISAISPPLWGFAGDRLRSIKKVFIIGLGGASVCFAILPFANPVWLLAALVGMSSFFVASLPSLLDTWTVDTVSGRQNISYGEIRLWGSIGFAILVFIYGVVIDYVSITPVFMMYLVLGVITIAYCQRIQTTEYHHENTPEGLNPLILFKDARYIAFIVFTIVLLTPATSSYVFLPQIVESVSGSRGQIGTIYAIKAASEIPFFFFSKRLLKRFSPLFLIAVSGGFFVSQFALYTVVETPTQIILMQIIHGPSFGIFMTGAVYYVYSLAPERLKATAQTLAYALRVGISGLIGSSLGGWVIDIYGVKTLFRWGSVLGASALLLYLLFQWAYQRRPKRKRIPVKAGTLPGRGRRPR